MGAGEITVIVMLILGGTWVAAKIMGFVWRIVRAPVLGFVDYFFEITSRGGAEDEYDGAGTEAAIVVPAQQHQAALELVPDFETIKSYLTDHTLTDEQAIELLALARRSTGDDLLSANKIRDIVGGNEGKVKAHVAAHRKPRPKPKAAQRLERPAGGWPA